MGQQPTTVLSPITTLVPTQKPLPNTRPSGTPLVGRHGRTDQLPSVLGKDGSDLRRIRMTTSHDWSKFFEECVRTARRKGHDALARLLAHVHEGMTRPNRDVYEAASLAAEHIIIDLHLVPALREED